MTRQEAREYRHKIEVAAEQQSDELALQSIELFPMWMAGISVTANERYQYDGVLYRVVQSHTTQSDWAPDITPALWTVVSIEDWPEWRQPTGAQDAYHIGDKVSHVEKHWISTADNNVWEPGVFGWDEV